MSMARPPAWVAQLCRPYPRLRQTGLEAPRWSFQISTDRVVPFTLRSMSRPICTQRNNSPLPSPLSTLSTNPRFGPFTSPCASIRNRSAIKSHLYSNPSRHSSTSQFTPETPEEEASVNPFKAKRIWPPDMSKLSEKQQFRLERKYRRRAKLKWARPVWSKWTKLVQWTLIGIVLIYTVLIMDLGQGKNPFDFIRVPIRSFFSRAFSTQPRPTFQGKPTEQPGGKPEEARS
ncbi:hypothetical protein AJ80_09260 [Polytolypa hystricis UAMH7299]|uniref:Uncharacterized protein n=1 Tax=Polytolypa hystricis (strain UAMH7299) TaxID=1447883 RepID=A0A2B7WKS7_POLH7|nr:hypothetical protein AJ80_09260 [Polytolypa hystricis UAMH7299]